MYTRHVMNEYNHALMFTNKKDNNNQLAEAPLSAKVTPDKPFILKYLMNSTHNSNKNAR